MYREANNKDAKELDKLLTLLIKDEANYDNKVKPMKIKNYYCNYINDPTRFIYVYEDNNKVVGYIYTILIDKSLKIDALYVEENYRNKGIASNLLNKVFEYAKTKDIIFITINVLDNNLKAKNIYSKYFELHKKYDNKEELIKYLK